MKLPLTPIRFLRYAEAQFPQATAVVCGEERFSYAQFADRAGRLAGALRAAGLQPGDRVAFLSANCHRLLEAYYGVIEAGGILLPLNIRLSPGELSYILNDSGARFLFLESQFLDMAASFPASVPSLASCILLDRAPEAGWLAPRNYESLLAAATPSRRDITEFDEDSVAELFYTSGTSAHPKGVMLTHRNVYLHAFTVVLGLQFAHEPTQHPRVELHTISLFHANGWGVAHRLTMIGGTHVIVRRFDPAEIFRLIERERAHACSLVPTMAAALVHSPERTKYDLSSLQRIMLGGAASSPTLVREIEEKLGCTCFGSYGLTETSPALSVSPSKPGLSWEGDRRYAGQAMTGFAMPGVELRVVDSEGHDVPHDGKSIGEIVARGDGIMEGYWHQPEATREAFRGGWFHTGDLATMDEHGYVLVADRKKDIIVSGGENISSVEVETVLLAHPSVYEIAVIPVPDENWGEVPKALVVLKPGATATESELLEFCRPRLAHYKAPRSVEFLESLPKTGTGKILKRDLRNKYWPAEKPREH
ncbi:MAG: long-chain-fatty-acid--CoA ligase [Acidobacteriia bacterium]|nr:long-chain-fatty-acid--CoA ligase [Terriglobia bacterium]